MSRIFSLILFFASFVCSACVGQKEDVMESDLQFGADKVLLSVDNNESAVFSVLFNGRDVTVESDIYDITGGFFNKMEEAVFTPKEAGEYKP